MICWTPCSGFKESVSLDYDSNFDVRGNKYANTFALSSSGFIGGLDPPVPKAPVLLTPIIIISMRPSIANLALGSLNVLLLFSWSVDSAEMISRAPLSNEPSGIHHPISIPGNLNDTSNDSFSFINDTNGGLLQQGWTPQPDGRGTIDIISQSVATIFLCCWTVLCLNVPPPTWGRWKRLLEKTLVACLGIVGPEFILQLSFGQWMSARRSVEDFKRLGYSDWSMAHAFLADMGGFVLHARDFVPFPLDAKQVHYLVDKGYIQYSAVRLDKEAIDDKNRGDGIARFITICQIIWFSFNCVFRMIQHLAITTLELTTIGFIICTLGTYFFWLHKPMDVQRAIVLEPNTTLTDILIRAGEQAKEPYSDRTPLDFVGRDLWSWTLYWTYWVNILRMMHIWLPSYTKKRPADMIPNGNFPPLSRGSMVVLFLFHITYGAFPLWGWNFHFPTQSERMLWHISALALMGTIVFTWIVDQYTWYILPALKNLITRQRPFKVQDSERALPLPCSHLPAKLQKALASLRNNSPRHDPAYDVPLKALIPVTTAGAVYCIARAYILLEDFVNLRALPPSAYDTVQWSGYFPHF